MFRPLRQVNNAEAVITSITTAVITNAEIPWPESFICCTFMPNIDEARLIGTNMRARMVTVRNCHVSNVCESGLAFTYELWHCDFHS